MRRAGDEAKRDRVPAINRRAAKQRRSSLLCREDAKEPSQRIVEFVHDPFLEGDDGIVGNGDVLGAHLGAALGDIAVPDAVAVTQVGQSILGVERVHLQRGGIDQQARADELIVLVMVPQHMADVLTQEAFDALAEFLRPLHVGLDHIPGAVGVVGGAGPEGLDGVLDPVVPRHIGHKILDDREGLHGLNRDWLGEIEIPHSRHAHQSRLAVDLGAARAALAGLAIPTAGQIASLLGLNLMHNVEYHHAVIDVDLVVDEVAGVIFAAPDSEGSPRAHSAHLRDDGLEFRGGAHDGDMIRFHRSAGRHSRYCVDGAELLVLVWMVHPRMRPAALGASGS